jgi:hypothetical protein
VPLPHIRRRRDPREPAPRTEAVRVGSPRWLAPLMVTLFLVGLLWIVVYYLSQAQLPVAALGNWNMAVGFGFIMLGFALSTQWK